MPFDFDLEKVELVKLSEEHIPDLAKFGCGDTAMNRFLKKEALEEQNGGFNITVLLYYDGQLTGFYSVCADAIQLTNEEQGNLPYAVAPAVKIARIGIDIKMQKRGFGTFLVEHVKDVAYELSKTKLGVRFITLDAYPERITYYERLGFIRNEHEGNIRGNLVSMRAEFWPVED